MSDLQITAEPGQPTIIVRRTFAAPPALLWEVFTNPKHLVRWWGPRVMKLVVCEVDLRVGGGYRYVQRTPDGQEFGFRGEYLEIDAPWRLVQTFVFEPMPDHGAVETATLQEVGGRTLFTTTIVHKSVEGRDGHLASGMEGGMRDTYARLDELLEGLAS